MQPSSSRQSFTATEAEAETAPVTPGSRPYHEVIFSGGVVFVEGRHPELPRAFPEDLPVRPSYGREVDCLLVFAASEDGSWRLIDVDPITGDGQQHVDGSDVAELFDHLYRHSKPYNSRPDGRS